MTRVLIVEDEPSLAESIRYGLEREGFVCSIAADGQAALERFNGQTPDLVLLDLMLPGLPGVDVCRAIRRTSTTPIIIVSARSSEVDKVVALEMGADDYITKPFGIRELIARVRAVLRRGATTDEPESRPPADVDILRGGPVELDTERHEARVNGELVILPPKEFMLLEYLMRRRGKLCMRDTLISELWGMDYFGDTRTLDVHVRRLRHKIEDDPKEPKYLKTIRGLGYKFET
jgi:two-component system, OmpR family, response regulator RegX3